MLTFSRVGLRILVLFLLTFSAGFAQQGAYLPYYANDTNNAYSLALSHRTSLQNAFVLPEGITKEYRKDFLALAEGLSENIYSTIRYRALLDTLIDPYVQEVFTKVMAANKNLPAARLVVVKSPVENAFALGDGTILVNVGLLSKLENESQLAFVICHELGHIYFEHMQKGIKEHFDTYYNKNFLKEYKKIVKEEYNMNAKLNSLLQNTSLNKLYHKRTHEQQADSLGYVLLSRTGYDVSQVYTALQLLDRIDEPYSSEKINFNRYFGCAQSSHLFAEKPKKAASIFAVEPEKPKAYELSDTLKTHPDCEKRMQYIRTLSQSHSQAIGLGSVNSGRFGYIKSVSRLEVIQSWYDAGRYDRALFEALLLLQKEPGNSYLQAVTMLCLYELKDHLRKHLYADVVAGVADYYPDNFNGLLENLHRLNLSDFEHLSSCFRERHPLNDSSGEYSLAATYAYYRLINEQEAADKVKEQYHKKYARGRLSASLFD